MADTNRRYWKRLALPDELMDLLGIIAKHKGWKDDELHLFLYHLLKETYPDDVSRLGDMLNTTWMDD